MDDRRLCSIDRRARPESKTRKRSPDTITIANTIFLRCDVIARQLDTTMCIINKRRRDYFAKNEGVTHPWQRIQATWYCPESFAHDILRKELNRYKLSRVIYLDGMAYYTMEEAVLRSKLTYRQLQIRRVDESPCGQPGDLGPGWVMVQGAYYCSADKVQRYLKIRRGEIVA